jgi:fatty-acyl-CoA synthase
MKELFEQSLGVFLKEQALKCGEKDFFVFPNRGIRYTFGDIEWKSARIAKGLLAAGFKNGDHIGIWANNVPEWPIVFYAAARIGLVIVPINSNYKLNEFEYVLGQADLSGLFVIDQFRDTNFVEILHQTIDGLKDAKPGKIGSHQYPCLRMVANMDDISHPGMYLMNDLIQMGNQIDDAVLYENEAAVNANDILCIIYTSGTTGWPKGAMLTHRNIINNAQSNNRMGALNENSVCLITQPFFYCPLLTAGIVEPNIYGYKIVALESFDALRCLGVIQDEKCTCIFAVPTIYIALLNHPRFSEFDITSLDYGTIGSTVCPPALMKTAIEKMGLKGLHLAYGITEASPFITDVIIQDASDPRLNTVGSPIPGVEVSIRDSVTNEECGINIQGEICVKGHGVMKGYYKMEDATRQAIDSEGWLHTGDIGRLLADGYLVIDGRIKDLIIRGGENVYPKEVENSLLSMPGIQEAQVVGIPSEKYGEEVGAFIILRQGEILREEDIIKFCKERISAFKTPKYVFFVDSYPLSAIGKVQKFKLREAGVKILQGKEIKP